MTTTITSKALLLHAVIPNAIKVYTHNSIPYALVIHEETKHM
jgi:hypothetical protein